MTIEVSVGIICRNEEKNIGDAIKSLIQQNFRFEFEIIIVDGDSSDNTRKIAIETSEEGKIHFKVVNEKDYGFYGPCFARNLVVKNASKDSKYIAFIDADCIAERNWLNELFASIKSSNDKIVGVGGPRRIAITDKPKEKVINALLTSYIASGGNPRFTKRNKKYVRSIPNYNAIYVKKILENNPYDNKLIISDDNELNYRLLKKGFKFLYSQKAIVYHHETDSIIQFSKNMFRYGVNITNTMKKHKRFIRPYIPLTLGFFIYILFLVFLFMFEKFNVFIINLIDNIINLIPFIQISSIIIIILPLLFYFIFEVLVFLEVFIHTKKLHSLFVFVLLPIQHFAYSLGIMYCLLFKNVNIRKS